MHAYASCFYSRQGGEGDFSSLDETALLGVGVLLETWAARVGRRERGVFVEGVEVDKRKRGVGVEEEEEEEEWGGRKRRKVRHRREDEVGDG